MTTHLRILASALAAVLVSSSSVAVAQPAAPPAPSPQSDAISETGEAAGKPWAAGVTPEARRKATELFKQGNQFLLDFNYNDAIAAYRQALVAWDHPRIHYNLALALINTAEPIEIYRSLEAALRWGDAAFDRKNYETAVRYKTLIEQQLVWITVRCKTAGAQVFVDGKPAHECPGESTHLLRAGEHSFSATKPGYETTAVSKVYPGGQRETLELRLYRPEDLTRYRRRFDVWVPWAVVGAGVAVAGAGGAFHAMAQADFDEFDQQIADCGGCMPSAEMIELRDGAQTKQTVAIVGYAVGGAALVTGITLLVLNRAQPYRIDAELVTPVVSADGAGVTARFHF